MNRNITALILIVLAIGIYFTYTRAQIDEVKALRSVNADYQTAIDNATTLITVRDSVLKAYNSLSDSDKERLNKLVPNTVDNVRLIIDVKDDIAARHGLSLRNIKTSSPDTQTQTTGTVPTSAVAGAPVTMTSQQAQAGASSKYGIVTLSFTVTSNYQTFIDFLKDLESSLRIMDISKLTVANAEGGLYDFGVEVRTYWLK